MSTAEWRLHFQLNSGALEEFDPRPVVTQLLVDVRGLVDHRERLYTVVAELFNNALEHGLLNLDSNIKGTSEGFKEYYRQRTERLKDLREGWISMDFVHQPTPNGGCLRIEVADSGNGFDYEHIRNVTTPNFFQVSRGLSVIRGLCDEIQHFPPGNRIAVTYEWEWARSALESENG